MYEVVFEKKSTVKIFFESLLDLKGFLSDVMIMSEREVINNKLSISKYLEINEHYYIMFKQFEKLDKLEKNESLFFNSYSGLDRFKVFKVD